MAIKSINGILLRNSIPNSHSLDLESSSSQYASIADASQTGLDITGDISIEARVKRESADANQAIAGKWSSGNGQDSYFFNITADNKLRFMYSNDGSQGAGHYCYGVSNGTLVAGQWYHVTVTVDVSAKTIVFYINGIAQTTTLTDQGATSIFNSTEPFYLGAIRGTYYFDGLIDEVRVWNDIRTATEIHDNIFADVTGQAGLVGYWKLDNAYTDSSGNGNTLTPSGSPVFSTDVPFPAYRALNPVPLGSTSLASDANLQGYYPLADVSDLSSNNYDLTNNNTVTFVAGKFGNAANFVSTSSQSLTIADASCPNLEISGSQTWGCWVKFAAGAMGVSQRIMCKGLLSRANYRFDLNKGAGNVIQGGVGTGSANVTNNADFVVEADKWYFVVVVLDLTAEKLKLYIDAIEQTNDATTAITTHGDSNAPFSIGCSNFGTADARTQFLDGIIDDAFVFDRALTATEIFDLYTGAFNIKSINGIETKDIKSINGVAL